MTDTLKKWVFDIEKINTELFQQIVDDCSSTLMPADIGGLEGDNTSITENKVELGGRGASGYMDMCEFVLDTTTGEITYTSLFIDDEDLGNHWSLTKDNIIDLLRFYRLQK